MILMQKVINGEILKAEMLERDLVRLKKRGWKIFKPAKKKEVKK